MMGRNWGNGVIGDFGNLFGWSWAGVVGVEAGRPGDYLVAAVVDAEDVNDRTVHTLSG